MVSRKCDIHDLYLLEKEATCRYHIDVMSQQIKTYLICIVLPFVGDINRTFITCTQILRYAEAVEERSMTSRLHITFKSLSFPPPTSLQGV